MFPIHVVSLLMAMWCEANTPATSNTLDHFPVPGGNTSTSVVLAGHNAASVSYGDEVRVSDPPEPDLLSDRVMVVGWPPVQGGLSRW